MAPESSKKDGLFSNLKIIHLLTVISAIVVCFSCFGFMVQPSPSQVQIEQPDVNDAGGEQGAVKNFVVDSVVDLICQGEFDVARQRVDEFSKEQIPELKDIEKIIEVYSDIEARRTEARQKVYSEKVKDIKNWELGNFDDINDINDINEPGDLNDVNNIVVLLSMITKASEFANDQQKEQLLADSFVQHVFQKSMERASVYESEGKWLDAYINSYSWLVAIDKENKGYSDYAERLLDKANIVASFQDSPCETSEERYTGVKKKMFVRAIDTLDYYYVSLPNYLEMTKKALERCELLGEVMTQSYSEIVDSKAADSLKEDGEPFFAKPDPQKMAHWASELKSIMHRVRQSPTGMDKAKFIKVLDEVLELNSKTAKLPDRVLIAQFSEAALMTLDPYTVMVWPKQAEDFDKMMTNEFTGVGIEISKRKGVLTAASLLPDTPAYRSGIDAGDNILKVDGVDTKDMTLNCAVKHITGPAGTTVTLTVKTPGEENTRDITITRAKIVVRTIRGWLRKDDGTWDFMVDKDAGIGYVRVTSFSNETAGDLEKAMKQLEKQGMKGLILDLRFNPGGLLTSAIEIVEKFVDNGLIVSTRPRGMQLGTYAVAHKSGTHPKYPLVILINSSSASASEIVSGALGDQRHNRAVLVGERTHGKGSVQGITNHPGDRAQLKYTMAYYHLPSGQRVESRDAMEKLNRKDWGVGPDVEIKLLSDETRDMFDIRRDNDVLAKADHKADENDTEKHTIEEMMEADHQLAVGSLVIKAQLLKSEFKAIAQN